MRLSHFALAILIVLIWSFNFVIIHLGLREISPLELAFLRFFLASMPAIFFVRRPRVAFKLVILYGLTAFAAQVTFLFMGMKAGMSPGLASLLLQSHIFFTIYLAILFLGEKPNKWQFIGGGISSIGILVLVVHVSLGHIPLLGFMYVLCAAAFWGIGNLVSKKIKKIDLVALVVWSSFVAWPPLLILSLVTEGTGSVLYCFHCLSFLSVAAIFYIVYLATLFGFITYNWLIHQYPVTTIAPFTMLVPILAMLSSSFILGEPLHAWKLAACGLVVTGLLMNTLAARIKPPVVIQPELDEEPVA